MNTRQGVGAMDLRNQECRKFRLDLELVDEYQFVCQASEDGTPHGGEFRSDEPDPVGSASAPATPALLGAAVGHCLSASLLEALRHAHLEVRSMTAQTVTVVAPNPEGLPRIDYVEVVISPVLASFGPRARRCEEVFERYCTVTSSVREGVDIRVRVDWGGDDHRDPAIATAVNPSLALSIGSGC